MVIVTVTEELQAFFLLDWLSSKELCVFLWCACNEDEIDELEVVEGTKNIN